MKLYAGRLFLDKIDQTRVCIDKNSRQYIDIVVILNDATLENGKIGVLQQNTNQGEKRIYLANLFKSTMKKIVGIRTIRSSIKRGLNDCESSGEVQRLESRLFADKEDC